MSGDYGPQVKLARPYEKTSKTGSSADMWDVLLQEAPSEHRRKPETKEALQPEATAAVAPPYSAKRLPDDSRGAPP